MVIKNKRGFIEIPFGWLFAIIIGAIIIFFAIYASVKIMNTEESVSVTETGKEVEILLSPLETSFGETKSTPLRIAVESRINNECDVGGTFGEQRISVSREVKGRWERGVDQIAYNRYIFSEQFVEGKTFYVFSKPFEFPFSVGNILVLTSSKEIYCFVNAPESIKEELDNLAQGNIFTESCPTQSTRICFSNSQGCDVVVKENEKTVTKDDGSVYYETDALMYGAIFSDKETYECQVQRLMKRTGMLAGIYNEKESNLAGIGCPVDVNLLPFMAAVDSVDDSSNLISAASLAEDIDNENKRAYCELW